MSPANLERMGSARPDARPDKRTKPVGLTTARFAVFSLLLIIQALIQYVPNSSLETAAGIVALVSWLVALPGSDKTSLILSLGLVGIGAAVYASTETDPLVAIVSFGENASILMIMVLVPLIGIVINLGGYADALAEVSRNAKRPVYLYGVALFLAYAIGSVVLNAAIALVWAVLAPIVERMGKDPRDFLVSSLPRGYDACLLWTPSSPVMASALVLTGASLGSVAWPGFVLSLVVLVLSVVIELRSPLFRAGSYGSYATSKVSEVAKGSASPKIPGATGTPEVATLPAGSRLIRSEDAETRAVHRAAWTKSAVLAGGLGSFIFAIVTLQGMGYSIFKSMVPCIAVMLTVWSLLIGKSRDTWVSTLRYFSTKMPGLSNQFLLMTTAGFIGTALRLALKNGIPGVSGVFQPGPLATTLFASFLVWGISIAGVHPLIGMTIVHSVVAPLSQNVSPAHLAVTLLMGAALGFSISPVSATILVTSSCAGQNSVEVGLKRQWKFVLVCWIACSLVLTLLGV